MKFYLAVALLTFVGNVLAVQCGPRVAYERIELLQKPIDEIGRTLLQHSESLQQQATSTMIGPQSEISVARVEKIFREIDLLSSAETAGERVSTALQTASVIAGIRDVMLDSRDRERVNLFLSNQLSSIGRGANSAWEYLNKLLTRITIPGVAIDVAKLRDAIAVTRSEFEKCEPGKPSTPKK